MSVWTTPISWPNGAVTAATMNAEIRDHLNFLKGALDLVTGSTTADTGTATLLRVTRPTTGNAVLEGYVSGDTQPRTQVLAAALSQLAFGPGGSTAPDSAFGRLAAGWVGTTTGTKLYAMDATLATYVFNVQRTTDNEPRLAISAEGDLVWGDGDGATFPTLRLRRPSEGQIEFSQPTMASAGINMRQIANAGGENTHDYYLAGDAVPRIRIQADGTRIGMLVGSGSGVADVELSRPAAGRIVLGTNGTANPAAFRVQAESGQEARLDVLVSGDSAVRGRIVGAASGTGLYFGPGSSGPTKVVGERVTGYTAMTGSGNKATAYDTATVTLAQLAGRVKQLQDDLTTHGLIGT